MRLSGVGKHFGETRALAGATLTAVGGEIHAVVGENGSGKSTLAKVISGVVLPDEGGVDVCGVHPANPRAARDAGIVTIYQEILLADDLTVLDNLFAGIDGLLRHREGRAVRHERASVLLERLVGEPVDPDRLVSTLPLSVRQWIVIARALLLEPRVLVFDESSAALDLEATERLHAEMLALRDRGACVLLVTHRIAELVKIADRATVLRDGATVGSLGRDEISEARLLELMSATARSRCRVVRAKSTDPVRRAVLVTEALQLSCAAVPIDFRLDAGEIAGIAGLDGAGQAGFVRALAGIDIPFSGQVTSIGTTGDARPIRTVDEAEQGGVTYVSGDRRREGLFPDLSIQENFGLAMMDRRVTRLGILDREGIRQDFEQEARTLKLRYGHADDRITTLSGGNQQKVLIARALARRARVIVLNDPTRGVDIGTKQDLYEQLRLFADGGGAVVFLSSELEEFFGLADRVDVFRADSVFATCRGADQIAEAPLLAALFGQADSAARPLRSGSPPDSGPRSIAPGTCP